MQSRRDQVQAQSYLQGRLTAALVSAEPEAPTNPNRRTVTGTVVGILVGTLIVAGFAIAGFLKPGGATAWRQPGVVVLEKETGSRYVLIAGQLRPVLNYASAMLLFGRTPKLVSVSRASLAGVPHGQPVGIVGAPDSLPRGAMAATAWTVCVAPEAATLLSVDPAALLPVGPAAQMPSGVGPAAQVPSGVGPAAQMPGALDDGHAMVAAAPGSVFLVWQGHRLRLTKPWLLKVFGYDRSVVKVPAGWLDVLPAGPDLGPVAVPGTGEPGQVVGGRQARVGELFVAQVAGLAQRYFQLRRDGLSELTGTGFAIASGDPDTARAYPGDAVVPVALSPADLARLARSGAPAGPAGLPSTPPALATPSGAGLWCVRQSIADGRVSVCFTDPGPAPVVPAGLGVTANRRTATAVKVRPGLGGLVRAGRLDQAPGSSYFLVTDAGVKYPLGSPAVAALLGYPPRDAATVPANLLDLLPTGPLLDPARVGG